MKPGEGSSSPDKKVFIRASGKLLDPLTPKEVIKKIKNGYSNDPRHDWSEWNSGCLLFELIQFFRRQRRF